MTDRSSTKVIQWATLISPIVTIIIGLGISWGVYTSTIDELKRSIVEIKEKNLKLENDVHELQLKQATDSQNLINIQAYLKEIREDIKDMKKMVRSRP